MVAPAATLRKSLWSHITSRSSGHRWLVMGSLTYGLLVVLYPDSVSDSILHYPEPLQHLPPYKGVRFLHCDDFLTDARRLPKNVSAVVDKIYAAYLTKYDPPFWISQHTSDMEILNKGKNIRQQEQTNLMERVLKEETSRGADDIVFYQPNDSGWFPLLAASKPGRRVVRVYHPQNHANIIRLCESILLNQWQLDQSNPRRSNFHENDVVFPRIQIISDPKSAFRTLEGLSSSLPIALLKLQGENLLTELQGEAFSSLLGKGWFEYLWVEYYEARDDRDSELNGILNTVSHSGVYDPYWPEPSSDAWSTERRSSHKEYNYWWRRKGIIKS